MFMIRITMKNALYYAHRVGAWLPLAESLLIEYNLKPVYWVTHPDNESVVNEKFPDIVTHCKYKAARGVPASDYSPSHRPIDSRDLLEQSSQIPLMFNMMDRMDSTKDFTYDLRFRHYRRLLSYWTDVIDSLEIEYVIFRQVPHMISDYAIYMICQQKDVTPIIFKKTPFPGIGYTKTSVQERSKPVTEAIESDPQIEIPIKIRNQIEKLQSKHPENKTAVSELIDNVQRVKNWIGPRENIPGKIRSVVDKPVQTLNQERNWWLKKKGQLPEEGTHNRLEYIIHRQRGWIKRKKLKQKYNELSSEPSLDEKYVYFPLHYQPEMTTSPQGGYYAHQFLVADLLSNSLPDSWRIYIKEHPVQFSRNRVGELGREEYQYVDLNDLASTELINVNFSPLDLIDNAEAVATVTGTAGWEAIVRGTPALTFGDAWYRYSEDVFEVETKEDVQKALQTIENQYEVDPTNIDKMVQALISGGYKYEERKSGWHKISPTEQNISTITDHLSKHINS